MGRFQFTVTERFSGALGSVERIFCTQIEFCIDKRMSLGIQPGLHLALFDERRVKSEVRKNC